MTRYIAVRVAALCVAACSAEITQDVDEQPSIAPHETELQGPERQGIQLQGIQLQGIQLQGIQLQGMTMDGFRFSGATLDGAALVNLRIEKGELVAERNQITVRGTALVNAHLFADVGNRNVHPPQSAVVEYKIDAIVPEVAIYDPTLTGNTFLYTIAQNVDNTGSWQLACPIDSDGRRAAIPLEDTWSERGDRSSSSQRFTFGCTTGAIAKCYRWGYRPWVTGYGNLVIMHTTCTRVARADYCGDGIPHTQNGTQINVWDALSAPGPIQARAPTPPGMTFEAAWGPNGAVCLSHARWNASGTVIAAACANRLRPPGQGMQPSAVCDSVAEALMHSGAGARMFTESNLAP